MGEESTISSDIGAIANALTGARHTTSKQSASRSAPRVVFEAPSEESSEELSESIDDEIRLLFKPGTPAYNKLIKKVKATKFATGDLPRDVRNYLKLKANADILLDLLGG